MLNVYGKSTTARLFHAEKEIERAGVVAGGDGAGALGTEDALEGL